MIVSKYKFPGEENTPFLIYGDESFPHEGLDIELIEFNIDLMSSPEDQLYPIMSVYDIVARMLTARARTRDKVLSEEGIDSFYDLQNAYHLLRIHKLNKSSRVRKFVEEKYSEIINMKWEELPEKTEEIKTT